MHITRTTLIKARTVAALSMIAVYFLTGMFFDLMLVIGQSRTICSVLGVAGAVWVWDVYRSMDHRFDYYIRVSTLGAVYGMAGASLMVWFG